VLKFTVYNRLTVLSVLHFHYFIINIYIIMFCTYRNAGRRRGWSVVELVKHGGQIRGQLSMLSSD